MDAQRKGLTELKEHTGRMNIAFEVRLDFIPTNFEFQYLVKNTKYSSIFFSNFMHFILIDEILK